MEDKKIRSKDVIGKEINELLLSSSTYRDRVSSLYELGYHNKKQEILNKIDIQTIKNFMEVCGEYDVNVVATLIRSEMSSTINRCDKGRGRKSGYVLDCIKVRSGATRYATERINTLYTLKMLSSFILELDWTDDKIFNDTLDKCRCGEPHSFANTVYFLENVLTYVENVPKYANYRDKIYKILSEMYSIKAKNNNVNIFDTKFDKSLKIIELLRKQKEKELEYLTIIRAEKEKITNKIDQLTKSITDKTYESAGVGFTLSEVFKVRKYLTSN